MICKGCSLIVSEELRCDHRGLLQKEAKPEKTYLGFNSGKITVHLTMMVDDLF